MPTRRVKIQLVSPLRNLLGILRICLPVNQLGVTWTLLYSPHPRVTLKALNAKLIEDTMWEAGSGHVRSIFTARALPNAVNDIYINPVSTGLCSDIMKYRWSSARAVLLDEEGERSW